LLLNKKFNIKGLNKCESSLQGVENKETHNNTRVIMGEKNNIIENK